MPRIEWIVCWSQLIIIDFGPKSHLAHIPASSESIQTIQRMSSVSLVVLWVVIGRDFVVRFYHNTWVTKYPNSLCVALQRVLRYIVIYLFIEWSKRVFHMILYTNCMGHITIVLFCSEGMRLIRTKDGASHICAAVMLFQLGFPYHCFQMPKIKTDLT